MYPEHLVAPMRAELTQLGLNELAHRRAGGRFAPQELQGHHARGRQLRLRLLWRGNARPADRHGAAARGEAPII